MYACKYCPYFSYMRRIIDGYISTEDLKAFSVPVQNRDVFLTDWLRWKYEPKAVTDWLNYKIVPFSACLTHVHIKYIYVYHMESDYAWIYQDG